MKAIIITIISIILFSQVISAQNYKSNVNNKYSLKLTDSTGVDKTRLSFGAGVATPFGSGSFFWMLNADYNFKIHKSFFFDIGYDAINRSEGLGDFIHGFYTAPNYKFKYSGNEYIIFAGLGPAIYAGEGALFAAVLFIKNEMSINQSQSFGIELKHANFFGKEFSSRPLFLINIYLTIKL